MFVIFLSTSTGERNHMPGKFLQHRSLKVSLNHVSTFYCTDHFILIMISKLFFFRKEDYGEDTNAFISFSQCGVLVYLCEAKYVLIIFVHTTIFTLSVPTARICAAMKTYLCSHEDDGAKLMRGLALQHICNTHGEGCHHFLLSKEMVPLQYGEALPLLQLLKVRFFSLILY